MGLVYPVKFLPMDVKTSGKLIQIHPKSSIEITESSCGKFLIKFSSPQCVPCQKLQEFLDSGSLDLKKDLTVYHVNIRDTESMVYSDLKMFFSFKSVPFCVVTDSSLDTIDKFAGFSDSKAFEDFIHKNFE